MDIHSYDTSNHVVCVYVLDWRSQQQVSSAETHKGAETCLPDDFISFSRHPYWYSGDIAQHNSHWEILIGWGIARVIQITESLVVGDNMSTELVPSGENEKSCWCLQWGKKILTSAAMHADRIKKTKILERNFESQIMDKKNAIRSECVLNQNTIKVCTDDSKVNGESRCGFLCRIPKQLPKTSIFPPLNLQYCVPSRSLSYFRSGKEPGFGKNTQSKYCCAG